MKTFSPLILTVSSFLVACTPLNTTIPSSWSSTPQTNFSGEKVVSDNPSHEELTFVRSYSGVVTGSSTSWKRNIEKMTTGYLHHFTFPYKDAGDVGKSSSVILRFQDSRSIEEQDIEKGLQGYELSVPKLNIIAWGGSITRPHDFGLRCFTSYSKEHRKAYPPQSFLFPSGTWEQVFISSYKELSSMTIPYMNYLEEPVWWINKQVFPQYLGVDPKLAEHYGKEDCIVVVGKAEHFSDLPFVFKGKASQALIALTQNKTKLSKCKELLGHERTIEFYTDKDLCTLWLDKNTTLTALEI